MVMKITNEVDLKLLNETIFDVYFRVQYKVIKGNLIKEVVVSQACPRVKAFKKTITSPKELDKYIKFIKSCDDAHLGLGYLIYAGEVEEAKRMRCLNAGTVYKNTKDAYKEYCENLRDSGKIDTLINIASGYYDMANEYSHDYYTCDFGSAFVAILRNV
jgi:hypothetical protein